MASFADLLAASPLFETLRGEAAARRPVHANVLECRDLGAARLLTELWVRTLQCPAVPTGGVACGQCPDCHQIDQGCHPGVVWLEPDGAVVKIDQVRADVIDRIDERVPGGRFRIFGILCADRLNEESGNTLLKVLEEPPPRTVFVLVTEDAEQVLPTLRSRSRALRLELPSGGELAERLGLAGEPARLRGILLVSGAAPGVLDDLSRGLGDPVPPGTGLCDLARVWGEALEAASDRQLLADPRPAALSSRAAEQTLVAMLEAMTLEAGPLARADWLHRALDRVDEVAAARAKAIVAAARDLHGDGYRHPQLERPALLAGNKAEASQKAFARQATTRSLEHLLHGLALAGTLALRVRAGTEGGLQAAYPDLEVLGRQVEPLLLSRVRRVRRAGLDLAQQNAQLLLESLFLDLAAIGSPRPAQAAAGAAAGSAPRSTGETARGSDAGGNAARRAFASIRERLGERTAG